MDPYHIILGCLVIGNYKWIGITERLSGVLIAEGSEKEKWFSISSTQERLEAIERTLDKIKYCVC